MDFEVPGDLTALTIDELNALLTQGLAAFQATAALAASTDRNATLRELRDAVTDIRTELAARAASEEELAAEAAELAAEMSTDDDAELADGDEGSEDSSEDSAEASAEDESESEQASAGQPRKISIPAIANQGASDEPPANEPDAPQVVMTAAADVRGFSAGQEIDWTGAAKAFNSRASTFPKGARPGSTPRMAVQFAQIETPFPDHLIVDGDDADETMRVMDKAADESALEGGSLTAAGGWCAPSEVLYDFCKLESRDGLFSLPGINIKRAGIRHTLGPDFRAIFDGTGFCFNEAEDQQGLYVDDDGDPTTPNVAGDKPCYDIPCPDFVEDRLDVCGVCITSGILQDRAYPELTRRVVEGAVTAHIHRVDMKVLAEVRNGSTEVTHTANPGGATAPLLSAIELEVEKYKYRNRLARSRTLEAVFPFWVRGVIRADLSRRQGLDLFDVKDSQIRAWFTMRGINPQFVVNWQDNWSALDNGQGRNLGEVGPGQIEWPTQVSFMLYTAGTWVRGGKSIIELTAVHDSTMFRQNNYTALFTEEAYLVAQRCHDSVLAHVPICADGATHGGILLECDGSVTP